MFWKDFKVVQVAAEYAEDQQLILKKARHICLPDITKEVLRNTHQKFVEDFIEFGKWDKAKENEKGL